MSRILFDIFSLDCGVRNAIFSKSALYQAKVNSCLHIAAIAMVRADAVTVRPLASISLLGLLLIIGNLLGLGLFIFA